LNEITAVIERIQQGEAEAYTRVIERFQDMAVGYAYAALGDLALAEDVAQEAFIAALREPAAFPGWFQWIVQTKINRTRRRREPKKVSLDTADAAKVTTVEPYLDIERQFLKETARGFCHCRPSLLFLDLCC